ncbi:alpha-(1-_3)-arabinofuranosyltransferase [Rhodococcus sp. NPDC047139]|uniref:alpha-(1->3)-arabinofuranosyltransferase n=1 Tax=Rhodococcus sp. NPDC047139 TaxID=3155141 RepID=UPI00340CD241
MSTAAADGGRNASSSRTYRGGTDLPSAEPLSRRWLYAVTAVAVVLSFAQVPGLVVADTKYDLTQNPIGFLTRAAHQWSSVAPLGQVQNQAYGYFFPHGSFFAVGQLLHIPPWITQRVWWVLLLVAGFWGIVRLAEALGVGNRGSRLIAATVFALSPRVLTTLGSISSEAHPMLLAPWVLLPLVRYLGTPNPGSPRRLAARSAAAVALMGAINAVATASACLVAALWWAAHRPNRRWWQFTLWWLPLCIVAVTWWMVPLLLLGRVSPPFLDFIESSGVTTEWTSLAEVLRGTSSWTPFVSPERIAGAVLVTQPAAVLVTGALAAAGLAGLAMRSMPGRGRLTLILMVGLVGMGVGYVGGLDSPFAEQVRLFLDSTGAPLRNVHKLEPLVRLPLVLGLAHLLRAVPLPGSVPWSRARNAFAHPERDPMVAVTTLIVVAATLATSLAWTGRLAPRGAYDEVPGHWHAAAAWLEDNTSERGERALIVPGAPFGSQLWGLTRDEPLQALASTPWAVRDAVPLVPPGAIRALDAVQRDIADGRPSDGLAATLRGQGIGYLVVRNDLDPDTSPATRPALVHRALDGSPGIEKVAEFGDDIVFENPEDFVTDADLRPVYPAVEIYRVTEPTAAPVGPYAVDVADVPVVQGGPESLLPRNTSQPAFIGPTLLAADAARAGVPVDAVTITDTPTDRETDYGQVDHHSSAIRAADDPRRTHNSVADYPVPDTELVRAEWEGARISVSSAASDATQLGGTSVTSSPAAVIDGDPTTGWHSNGLESAIGQWLQLDLDRPIEAGLLHLTTSPGALGDPVEWLEVSTERGSTAVRVDEPGREQTVALPLGSTSWIRITSVHTERGTVGNQFGLTEVSVDDFTDRNNPRPIDIRRRIVVPGPDGNVPVHGWQLGQEFPGRGSCVDTGDRVRCARGLAISAEEPGAFTRTLTVPEETRVRPQLYLRARPGPALENLVDRSDRVVARGDAHVVDLQGSAFALTDGDPRTSWTATEDSLEPGAPRPSLTLELPTARRVTGLDIETALGALPVAPAAVAVNLGNGPQVRELDGDDTVVDLAPHVTDRIELTVVRWRDTLDRTVLGFSKLTPPGLAEVTVLGDDGPVGTQRSVYDETVTVGCETGPVVDIGGRNYRTSVTASVADLAAGREVPATLCDSDVVGIDPGRVDIDIRPGPAFVVSSLQLAVPGSEAPTPEPTELQKGRWTENLREVTVPEGDEDRLVVVPESTNVGWVARTPDGAEATPVVVDGWQQGWIVPAGPEQVLTLEFATDRWYRLGIFGGLLLLLPLFAAALWPQRRRDDADPGPMPRTWRSPTIALAGVLVAAVVLAGVVGAVVVAVGAAGIGAIALRRNPALASRILVVIAGGATMLAMALLSTGPWRSPEGYIGHSALIQFAALVGVVAVGLAAVPRRALSQRWKAARDGSSTSA